MEEQHGIAHLKKEYEEYRFQRLERISEKIHLVWDRENGELCCFRKISPAQREIYLALSEIRDRHLPRIVHVGEDYVVEEFIKGENLKKKTQNQYFSKKQLCTMLKQLLPTVRKLHRRGIVHRDIKASNILVDEDERYYLIDFDISMKEDNHQTEEKEAAGTVEYASPEQYGYQECDARSDIYSLGVLMNVLLMGQVPKKEVFHGKIGRCIKKCTMLDRKDRYQSVEELERALFGIRRYAVVGICIVLFCATLGMIVFCGMFRKNNGLGIKSIMNGNNRTVQTDLKNKKTNDYLWKKMKDCGIQYPCLKEMKKLSSQEGKGTTIAKIETDFLKKMLDESESPMEQIYYETSDHIQIALAAVCSTKEKTGYEFLENMQELQKDKFGYSSATNTSYCMGETYNEKLTAYYAGTYVKGVWLFMELLAPKSSENICKEYVQYWSDAIKMDTAQSDWKAWEQYGTGKYISQQSDVTSSKEKSVEITSIHEGEVLFSITETTVESYQKDVCTTGYIRAWIVADKALFTCKWGDLTYQGSLERIEDTKGFLLKLNQEEVVLTKEE